MRVLSLICMVVVGVLVVLVSEAQDWEVRHEDIFEAPDGSRSRVVLAIGTEATSLSHDQQIEMMMDAALQRYGQGGADSILVSLHAPYEEFPHLPLNHLVYAPDGCGFFGQNCVESPWREPAHGVLPEPESVVDLGVTVGDVLDALVELVEGGVLDELPKMITESDEEFWYMDVQSDEADTDLVLHGVLDHHDSNQKLRKLTEVHFLQEVTSDATAVIKGLAILGAVGKAVISDWPDPGGGCRQVAEK